jgi:hypothetical protein
MAIPSLAENPRGTTPPHPFQPPGNIFSAPQTAPIPPQKRTKSAPFERRANLQIAPTFPPPKSPKDGRMEATLYTFTYAQARVPK